MAIFGRSASLPALLALVVGLSAGTGGASEPSREVTVRWVEVEGRRIRALCTAGPVEALLLHDRDAGADAWLPVLRRLDGRLGACAYDRAGHGESDPAPAVRGWFELLDELAGIHRALAPGRPVLVGHGVGGLYARLHALDRPAGVAGLVLAEPETEGMLEEMRRGMPDGVWRARMEGRRRPNADGVRVGDLLDRAAGRRLPELPVTVLTATRRPEGEGWTPRWLNEAARRHQGRVAAGLGLGRHLPATGSGPDLPREAPELLAEEIIRVARLGGR